MSDTKKRGAFPRPKPEEIRPGDMPGDRVCIDASHIERAEVLFPLLLDKVRAAGNERTVLSVYGGSGVGKSEIGALLGHYFSREGFPSYVLSGDNYPRRIPVQNDAERLNRFRSAGLAAAASHRDFQDSWDERIHASWENGEDAAPEKAEEHQAFRVYRQAGREALAAYLGSHREIDFALVNRIVRRFKEGEGAIPLKRMGRSPDAQHFETVDFRETRLLIIEWTHGNNPALEGVDFPVFLYSTPEETLAHRLSRGRDKGVDSAFTRLVLEIEQEKLDGQAPSAVLIIRKNGALIAPENWGARG